MTKSIILGTLVPKWTPEELIYAYNAVQKAKAVTK